VSGGEPSEVHVKIRSLPTSPLTTANGVVTTGFSKKKEDSYL